VIFSCLFGFGSEQAGLMTLSVLPGDWSGISESVNYDNIIDPHDLLRSIDEVQDRCKRWHGVVLVQN
jgi:hypothetical protein